MATLSGRTDIPARGLVLFGLFFLSGVSALAYQTIWQRMLGLIAGSDAVAATLIVGAFLFGLGIGSMLGATLADRLSARSAVTGFALCEIAIGAIGAGSKYLFHDLLFHWLAPIFTVPVLTFLAIVLALLPPTVLMGLSLPLLARAIVRSIATAPRNIGWLYGLNTLGAAAGSALAGCIVIPLFGYEVTAWVAGAINIGVGLIALVCARGMSQVVRDESVKDRVSGPASHRNGMREWCAVVFVSGFLIISLEIVWFRVLGIMMQSNAYYFTLVLTVFLLGDALGIIAGAELARRVRAPRLLFLRLQGAVALYALLSLAALAYSHGWFGLWPEMAVTAHQRRLSRVAIAGGFTALTMFVVLPPAFLLGLSFPLVHKAVQDDPRLVGTRVGWIQLANIFGNTAGAVVSGLFLLHWVGTTGTLQLIALIGVAMTLWPLCDRVQHGPRMVPLTLAALLLIALPLLPGQAAFWARLHGTEPGANVLVGEDRTGVVVLRPPSAAERLTYAIPAEAADARLMYILGHTQSRLPFMPEHGVLGMVGPLIHPDPKRVLVIGHGTGGTPYGVAMNPRPEHIRVVEIIGPVFPLLRQLAADPATAALATPVRAMLNDRRVEHVVSDARHVLLLEDTSYDVIEADAIYPWSSHAGLLYSEEFFRQVLYRLTPGGIFVQWAATERTRDTVLSVFPHVIHVGFVLLASNRPIPFSKAGLSEAVDAHITARMSEAGWTARTMLASLLDNPERVWGPGDPRTSADLKGGDLNSDLFPRDEYGRPRAVPAFGSRAAAARQ